MIYAIIVYENKGKAKRERGTIMQYKWVKRIIVAVVFTFMAGTMSIPALIGTDVALDETVDGKFAVVDGTNGVLYVEPDEETLETMRRRQQEEQEMKRRLRAQLAGRLSAGEIPQEIRFLETLPKNESGKVRKRDLI